MIRYFLAASVLKMFSSSSSTKRIYRALGNSLGAKKRSNGQMPEYYLNRVRRFLQFNRTYGMVKDGSKLAELGTGWLHWEAITTRLFFKIDGVLFDVWDNRQLAGLKNYLAQLQAALGRLELDDAERARAGGLLDQIKCASSLEEIYSLLGFRYVLNECGLLTPLGKDSFDLIVSAGVLEHIHEEILSEFVGGVANILKPGGFSLHEINLRDHLFAYDRSVSTKQYLKYSNRRWKRWFENGVQYINRVQRSEWLRLFRDAGLELVHEDVENEDISGIRLSRDYQNYEKDALRCGGLTLLHRKPQ